MDKFIELVLTTIQNCDDRKRQIKIIVYALKNTLRNYMFEDINTNALLFVDNMIDKLLLYNAVPELINIMTSTGYDRLYFSDEKMSNLSEFNRISILLHQMTGGFNLPHNVQDSNTIHYLKLINRFSKITWEDEFMCRRSKSEKYVTITSSNENEGDIVGIMLYKDDWLPFIKIFINSNRFLNFIKYFIEETVLDNSTELLEYILSTSNCEVLVSILNEKQVIEGKLTNDSKIVSIPLETSLNVNPAIFHVIYDKSHEYYKEKLEDKYFSLFRYIEDEYFNLSDSMLELVIRYFNSEIRNNAEIESLVFFRGFILNSGLCFPGNPKIFSSKEIIEYFGERKSIELLPGDSIDRLVGLPTNYIHFYGNLPEVLVQIIIDYLKVDPYGNIRNLLNYNTVRLISLICVEHFL